MRPIFVLPVLFGLGLLAGSLVLFRHERLDPRNFAIAIVLSGMVAISPLIYWLLDTIGNFLNFVYTFVLGFGIAILVLVGLNVYLVLSIGSLRSETDEMWQEVALLRADEREGSGEAAADSVVDE